MFRMLPHVNRFARVPFRSRLLFPVLTLIAWCAIVFGMMPADLQFYLYPGYVSQERMIFESLYSQGASFEASTHAGTLAFVVGRDASRGSGSIP